MAQRELFSMGERGGEMASEGSHCRVSRRGGVSRVSDSEPWPQCGEFKGDVKGAEMVRLLGEHGPKKCARGA